MSVPAMRIDHTPTAAELLQDFSAAPPLPVLGIASDSRQLEEGFLFLACQGIGSHGLDYLQQAIDAGACAVAWDSSTGETPGDCDIPTFAVEGLAENLGEIANRFYGAPSQALDVIGVTGTNGKTTIAWLLAECLQILDQRCGYIGTLGFGIDELHGDDGMTTPAAVELHSRLAGFVDDGASAAALEVSSHALSQRRVDGVSFAAAIFSNLTRDHLDYHGDLQSYFESKASLFLAHGAKHKIINTDSEFGVELAARCGKDYVAVSTRVNSDVRSNSFVSAKSVMANEVGSQITVLSSWGEGSFTLPLPGDFNVENALLVLAYLLVSGVDMEKACDVLQLVEAPPGRMQRVATSGAAVYIDYAHTPDALGSALTALRSHCDGKLWCVFGCGGDRDTGKRPLMAAVAEDLADQIVVTTDNPRSEEPQVIIADVMGGFQKSDAVTVIEDRATAIAWVVASAASNDAVLVAGKGHENYQDVDGERHPFSDYALVSAATGLAECDE